MKHAASITFNGDTFFFPKIYYHTNGVDLEIVPEFDGVNETDDYLRISSVSTNPIIPSQDIYVFAIPIREELIPKWVERYNQKPKVHLTISESTPYQITWNVICDVDEQIISKIRELLDQELPSSQVTTSRYSYISRKLS